MTTPDRNKMRMVFFEAWRKYQAQENLQPLEQQIIEIVTQHPEYHFILNNPEKYLEQDYFPELGRTNPFLHLSLHVALLEQLTTDRPKGIREIFQNLLEITKDQLAVEHSLIEILEENLWQAQKTGEIIKDKDYIKKLEQALLIHKNSK